MTEYSTFFTHAILNPRLGLAMLMLHVNNNTALFVLPSHDVSTHLSPLQGFSGGNSRTPLRIPKPRLPRHHLGSTRFSMPPCCCRTTLCVVSNKLLDVYTTHIFHLQTSSSAPSKLSMLIWAPLRLLGTIFHFNGECNRTGGASGSCK